MTPNFSPPPIHDFLDRGLKWLLEFTPNLADLIYLIAHELAGQIDFNQAQQIPTHFIPDNLRLQESDLLFLVLLIYYRREEPERQPLLQVVEQNIQDQKHREEVSKMGLTGAEFLRQQGEHRILMELMEIKFGSVPPTISQAVETIEDTETLRTLLHRILTASTLPELESLLNGAK